MPVRRLVHDMDEAARGNSADPPPAYQFPCHELIRLTVAMELIRLTVAMELIRLTVAMEFIRITVAM